MGYGKWDSPRSEAPHSFSDKAFRRDKLPPWDAKWHKLTRVARQHFLNEVEGPVKRQNSTTPGPGVAADKFPAKVLKELVAAGFVEARPSKPKGPADRVFAAEAASDFALRLKTIKRFHLLGAAGPGEFAKYVQECFYADRMYSIINLVLRHAGIDQYLGVKEAIPRYIVRRRWPGWVADASKNALIARVLAAIREADGPIRVADLPGRLKGARPDAVAVALETLITQLAVVEDLDPKTDALMVGLLPAVLDDQRAADKPRHRPGLEPCPPPSELGPEGILLINDLRATLLEVAGEPAQVRQDGAIFSREVPRFVESLGPLPPWLMEALASTDADRLNRALGWAVLLGLVKQQVDGKQTRLALARGGTAWLAAGPAQQYPKVFEILRAKGANSDRYSPQGWLFFDENSQSYGGRGDERFLGDGVMSIRMAKKKRRPSYWDVKPEDCEALREAVDKALAVLKHGVFYRLGAFLDHAVFGDHNPLLLGQGPNGVVVFENDRAIPPLEEEIEEAGRGLLDHLVRRRLIPLGALRAGVDDQGRLCVARTPRLDAYFGRKSVETDLIEPSPLESKVVVQPDFSVVVIGLNPAPAAELAPFCERTTKGMGQGAHVFKLTRQSVVKAVTGGMKPKEITDRLERLATGGLPANVAREVKEWAAWVRHVTASTITVIRCPDREAADRAFGILKRQAERITDTMVAVDFKALTSIERTKLREQGIVVDGEAPAAPKAKKARH